MTFTEDTILDGRVQLRQPERGYRAGLDAALLAASLDSGFKGRAIEAGCGAGGALLAAAYRHSEARFVGVERDESALDLAKTNIDSNSWAKNVEVASGDVDRGFRPLGLPPFDAAFANPPFFDDASELRAPSPEKLQAWMADGGLESWIGFLLKSVREGGVILLIHRADRLADILSLLSPKAGSFKVRPVQPFADAPAKRILVRAIKTGKAPLVLLPPLILRDRALERHTDQVEAILRGTAGLAWE